ncbi:MAG: hypothetical protein HZA24_06170 [Nitrospirae bacterium]|nr:hypothetical protein [Nitrospirota bacterium]
MKTLRLNRLAMLAGTLFTLTTAGTAHGFGSFGSTVQAQCDRLAQPIAASVNINDCATCHGNPFTGQNSGNMYFFAYAMSDWGQFCPVTVSAPPVIADTGSTTGSGGGSTSTGTTTGSTSTGSDGGVVVADDDMADDAVAENDMDDAGDIRQRASRGDADDMDDDTRRHASRGDADDMDDDTRRRASRGGDLEDGGASAHAERGITRSTEARSVERPVDLGADRGSKRRGRGDDSEG